MTSTITPETPAPEPATGLDPRLALGLAMETATPVLGQAVTADPTLATPCDTFTLHDLIAHVLGVGRRIVAMGEGRPATSEPASFEPADGDWMGAWQQVIEQTTSRWPDLDPATPTVTPWATMPATQAAAIYTNEVLVHAWDLATALGTEFAPDDALVAVASEALAQQLPATGRAEAFAVVRDTLPAGVAWADPFGEAVPVSDDASPIQRLAALAGRTPDWSPPTR